MREIKSKAKRKDNDEWVYGYYWTWTKTEKHFIRVINEDAENIIEDIEIDPYTLCQYIGLKDKNEKEIYESDLVYNELDHHYGVVQWNNEWALMEVEWDDECVDTFNTLNSRILTVIERKTA